MLDGNASGRQAHRLLQVGSVLFLFALLVGIAVPRFAVPRLGLSTHLLGLMQGIFLMVLGLVWPRLKLSGVQSTVGSSLAVYGCIAAWAANLLAAVWGAGNSMLPLAAGSARGSVLQETVIRVLLISAAGSLVSAAGLTVWGLRATRATDPPR